MKNFKQYYLEEKYGLATLAALGLATGAMAAPPKQEAMDKAVEHIKNFEGFLPKVKVDTITTGKPLTIGYGITGKYPNGEPIKQGDSVSLEQAEEHLRQHIEKHVSSKLEKIPGWDDMDAGKQAALIGFAYNTGGAFYGNTEKFGTITKALKNKDWDSVPAAMKLYNKSDGQIRSGLVRRRNAEATLWNSGESAKPVVARPKPQTQQPTSIPQSPKQQEQPKWQPTSIPAPQANPGVLHTVAKGDNLTTIANKYKTTVDEITKKNPSIKDPNFIKPGQKITIK